MDDLFSTAQKVIPDGPLADRMRPQTLDDVIGQDHIVGPGRLLRRAIQADRLSSVIFYGPPGTGKTSLARVIANTTKSVFESLNAVLSGVKDIREAIDRADERRRLYGRRTILFVDEVHRWNKAQQDALLPWVENGTVILVGATTENPFFEVNRALVSRSRIFQLKSLTAEDLQKTAARTLADRERGYGKWTVRFEEGALEHLLETAGGDARSLLNALELAVETSVEWPPPDNAEITVSLEAAEESIQKRAVLYDKEGDYHFDTISAFIKSVRGSDPDAALYWLAKMVRAGEDPSFIFRRMIILAGEDVGMADPNAVTVVTACADAFDRIGFPEGNFPLAQACLYLATAPKSNSALAFFDALKEVDREDAEVPNPLRDSSRDAEGFGHGQGYIYPHAYRDHWAAQQYLPTALRGKTFYMPSEMGYEARIRDEVLRKRELQAAMILGEHGADAAPNGMDESVLGGELLSWSPSAKGREGWFKRLESGRSALLLSDRNAILDSLALKRHSRILIPHADDGLLLWESLRRTPEGLCAALVSTQGAREALEIFINNSKQFAEGTEKPIIKVQGAKCDILTTEDAEPRGDNSQNYRITPCNSVVNKQKKERMAELLPIPAEAENLFGTGKFDAIALREPFRREITASPEVFATLAEQAAALLETGGRLALLASPPVLGERVSRILRETGRDNAVKTEHYLEEILTALEKAETEFFTGAWAWTGDMLEKTLAASGFAVTTTLLEREEERLITEKDLAVWFDGEKSAWGKAMETALGGGFADLHKLFLEKIRQGPVLWRWKSMLFKAVLQYMR
ncbi:MAG: AAA family ATPase [Spirochaetaceae bacterium]|jgi:putative ATPase|nr:AAA family ATPase [Spirochaetaceae bacterium]